MSARIPLSARIQLVEDMARMALSRAGGGGGGGAGFVYIHPIDGVVDDWPTAIATTNTNAYKNLVVWMPGTAGQHYQCKSTHPVVSGVDVLYLVGTKIDVPSVGSTLAGAAYQAQAVTGAAFLLDVTSPNPVPVGSNTLILTANPGIGAKLFIRVDSGGAGSIFTVTGVAGGGPFTVTLDRPMNYALANTNPATQSIDLVVSQPQDMRFTGPAVISGPGGSGFYNIGAGLNVKVTGVIADASQGSNATSDGFRYDVGSVDCTFDNCECSSALGHGFIALGAERCAFNDCTALQVAVTGFAFLDCVDCSASNLNGEGGINGLGWSSGAGLGCFRCSLGGQSHFYNYSAFGIKVEGGSYDITIEGAVCSNCASAGLDIEPDGTDYITINGFTGRGNNVGVQVNGGSAIELSGAAIDVSGSAFATPVGILVQGSAELTASDIAIRNAGASGGIQVVGTGVLRLTGATIQGVGVAGPACILAAGSALIFASKVKAILDGQGFALQLNGTSHAEVDHWTFAGVDAGISYGFYSGAAGTTLKIGPGNQLDQIGRPTSFVGGENVSMQQSGGVNALADGNPTLTYAQMEKGVIAMTPTVARTVSLPVAIGASAIAPPGQQFIVENDAPAGATLTVQVTGGTGFAVAAGKKAIGYVDKTGLAFVRASPDT
jgi:hypothetical protein